jgi:hypothetical protein
MIEPKPGLKVERRKAFALKGKATEVGSEALLLYENPSEHRIGFGAVPSQVLAPRSVKTQVSGTWVNDNTIKRRNRGWMIL